LFERDHWCRSFGGPLWSPKQGIANIRSAGVDEVVDEELLGKLDF